MGQIPRWLALRHWQIIVVLLLQFLSTYLMYNCGVAKAVDVLISRINWTWNGSAIRGTDGNGNYVWTNPPNDRSTCDAAVNVDSYPSWNGCHR